MLKSTLYNLRRIIIIQCRVILFVDQQRVLERNAGRNQPQGRTVGTPGRNEGHTNNINIIPDASSNRCTFTSVRRIYRRYLGRLFQDKEIISLCLLCHLTFMTFSRFIAGAVKLSSDCEDESNAAVYLFVKSWFEFFLHVAILLFLYKDKIEKALDNLFVQVWLIIQTTFSIIWLIVGTAWVFGNYKDMTVECPLYVEDWDFHFINFALFLTVIDWIGAVIFVIYSLYVLFEMYEGIDVTDNSN
ncbi:Zinc ion binding [Mactra antiquata]